MEIKTNEEKYYRMDEDNRFVDKFLSQDSSIDWEEIDEDDDLKNILKFEGDDEDKEFEIDDINVYSFIGGIIVKELATIIEDEDIEALLEFVERNEMILLDVINNNEDAAHMLVIAYKMGIEYENGECANNLGALYYSGDGVEQDYKKAKELYELGAEYGSVQAQINLGYIYEYGRTGSPDYAKAYMCYSIAAALDDSYEALYKMGDMFSRGKPFGKDICKAYKLWEKSFEVASNEEEESQAAIRIARLLSDEKMEKYGIVYNPICALSLYQKAEIGIRISIKNGMTYYRKRLQEAIDGQAKSRVLLEEWD